MTQDEIIELGKQAGLCDREGRDDNSIIITDHLERFAKLVAEKALKDHAMREAQRIGQEIEQKPVAWPCLIDSADFSENTITLAMQCEDYKVSAGTHYLSTTPPQRTEQEPVAWMDADGNVSDNNDHKCFPIPLYTTQPQRKPLTEEDCRTGFREQDAKWTFRNMTAWQVWRTACEWNEAAHNIKENT